jgi:hypothetical protein
MQAIVDRSDLEATFGEEAVARAFTKVLPDNTTEFDDVRLQFAIRMGTAEFNRLTMAIFPEGWPAPYPDTIKQLVGQHLGKCARNSLFPEGWPAPYPDTIKQLVCPIVMHWGYLAKPEYQVEPNKSPFFALWGQARADTKELRGPQRATPEAIPAAQRVSVINHNPESSQPGFFIPRPDGSGGLSGY